MKRLTKRSAVAAIAAVAALVAGCSGDDAPEASEVTAGAPTSAPLSTSTSTSTSSSAPSSTSTSSSAPPGQDGIWVSKADMPSARTHGCAVVVDQKIYAIGGWDPEWTPHSDVWVYDPATDSWDTSKAPMPTARGEIGCAAVDGNIYVIGGAHNAQLNASIYSAVEMYDPITDTWTAKSPLPTPTTGHTVSAVNGMIYSIGGMHDAITLLGSETVEAYDPITDTWTSKTNNPTIGWGQQGGVLDGKLYVTGGVSASDIDSPADPTANFNVYDPISDSWDTSMAPMLTGRYHLATGVIDGRIYAFGGFKHGGFYSPYETVEQYDSITNSWTQKADLPLALAGVSSAVLDGKIYLIGGTSTRHTFTGSNGVFAYDPSVDATAAASTNADD